MRQKKQDLRERSGGIVACVPMDDHGKNEEGDLSFLSFYLFIRVLLAALEGMA